MRITGQFWLFCHSQLSQIEFQVFLFIIPHQRVRLYYYVTWLATWRNEMKWSVMRSALLHNVHCSVSNVCNRVWFDLYKAISELITTPHILMGAKFEYVLTMSEHRGWTFCTGHVTRTNQPIRHQMFVWIIHHCCRFKPKNVMVLWGSKFCLFLLFTYECCLVLLCRCGVWVDSSQ